MWWLLPLALASTPPPPEQIACDQGIGEACTVLGHAYLVGDGVPKDSFAAVQLFRKGCELADPKACMWLAEAYRTGNGMRLDVEQAIELYSRACELKNGVACRSVGDLYTMGAAGLADGKAAGAWYASACDAGDAQSCTAVAMWIERGEGGAPDPARSLALFERACEGGHLRGCTMLGDRYLRGSDGAPKDVVKAYQWYRKACTAPFDPEGCREYGLAEIKGKSVPQDVAAGIDKLDRACYGGDTVACRQLAMTLEREDRGAEALMAGQRGCDLGDRASCLVAARVRDSLARDIR